MSPNLYLKRFDISGTRIVVSPQGRSLVTAARSTHKKGENNLFEEGLVILSGLPEDVSHTHLVRYFAPLAARQLECRMPAMAWHELGQDGTLTPVRLEWGPLMNTMERSVRSLSAHILGLDWFITPQESTRRLILKGGTLAEDLLERHRQHHAQFATQNKMNFESAHV